VKYLRIVLVATGVFTCCFLVLKLWLELPDAAASIAAGISALGALAGFALGLVKTTLEIAKLTQGKPKAEAGKGWGLADCEESDAGGDRQVWTEALSVCGRVARGAIAINRVEVMAVRVSGSFFCEPRSSGGGIHLAASAAYNRALRTFGPRHLAGRNS
jgi:hypothetical protein